VSSQAKSATQTWDVASPQLQEAPGRGQQGQGGSARGNAFRKDQLQSGSPPGGDPREAFEAATAGGGGEVPYRDEMEALFGEDFEAVRAFFDQGGNLEELGADAAALGDQIAFGEGMPDKELVAHELAHVVQARNGGGEGLAASAPAASAVSQHSSSAEVEARQVGASVAAGKPAGDVGASASGLHLAASDGGSTATGGGEPQSSKKVPLPTFKFAGGTLTGAEGSVEQPLFEKSAGKEVKDKKAWPIGGVPGLVATVEAGLATEAKAEGSLKAGWAWDKEGQSASFGGSFNLGGSVSASGFVGIGAAMDAAYIQEVGVGLRGTLALSAGISASKNFKTTFKQGENPSLEVNALEAELSGSLTLTGTLRAYAEGLWDDVYEWDLASMDVATWEGASLKVGASIQGGSAPTGHVEFSKAGRLNWHLPELSKDKATLVVDGKEVQLPENATQEEVAMGRDAAINRPEGSEDWEVGVDRPGQTQENTDRTERNVTASTQFEAEWDRNLAPGLRARGATDLAATKAQYRLWWVDFQQDAPEVKARAVALGDEAVGDGRSAAWPGFWDTMEPKVIAGLAQRGQAGLLESVQDHYCSWYVTEGSKADEPRNMWQAPSLKEQMLQDSQGPVNLDRPDEQPQFVKDDQVSKHETGPAPQGWEGREVASVASEQVTSDDPGHVYHLLADGQVVATTKPVVIDSKTAESVRKAKGDTTSEESAEQDVHNADLEAITAYGVDAQSGDYVRQRWGELTAATADADPAAMIAKARIAGNLARRMVSHMGDEQTRRGVAGDASGESEMAQAFAQLGKDLWSGWIAANGSGSGFRPPDKAWAETRTAAKDYEGLVNWMERCVGAVVAAGQTALGGTGAPMTAEERALHQTTLSRHQIVEILAHEVAYGAKLGPKAEEFGLDEHYKIAARGDVSENGFSCIYAIPTGTNADEKAAGYPPVIAFRGTAGWLGVKSDLDPDGETGDSQFEDVKASVQEMLSAPIAGAAIFTGHSLGGSLAQAAAAFFKPQGMAIGEVVTFNSPGIPKELVADFEEAERQGKGPETEVTHYTRAEDAVSRAGQAALPGTHVRLQTNDMAAHGDSVGAHTKWMFEDNKDGSVGLDADHPTVSVGKHQDDRDRDAVDKARRMLGRVALHVESTLPIDIPDDFQDWKIGTVDWPKVLGAAGVSILSPKAAAAWAATYFADLASKVNDVLKEVDHFQDPSLKATLRSLVDTNMGHLQTALNKKICYLPGVNAILFRFGSKGVTCKVELSDFGQGVSDLIN
jgi:hypothetical protein